MNLILYVEAGIYKIYCSKTNKTYIGESQNLLERFGNHFGHLNRSTHDCCQLQKDWNKYGKQSFTVAILCIGPEWQHKKKRVARQNEFIANLPLHERYNPSSSNNGAYRQTIEIENQIYSSIASAAETFNLSESTQTTKLLE